ncbi:MAG: nucleotidyltransferase family protein [Rhizomicrobium sp.]
MIRRAMVMAAGLGLRMRPLTSERPKPLIEVGGKALIDHSLDRLVAAGVEMAVVNLHYKPEMLRAHLAGRRDIEVRYSMEDGKPLDTGGGAVKALSHFNGEPFFILNSDSIWTEGYNSALATMTKVWDDARMDGLLLLAPMVTALGYEGWRGDFRLSSTGQVSRRAGRTISPFAFPGVQIAHPRLFADPPGPVFSTNVVWDRAIARRRLHGVRLEGTWLHVGSPKALGQAEAFLAGRRG